MGRDKQIKIWSKASSSLEEWEGGMYCSKHNGLFTQGTPLGAIVRGRQVSSGGRVVLWQGRKVGESGEENRGPLEDDRGGCSLRMCAHWGTGKLAREGDAWSSQGQQENDSQRLC